MITEKKLLMKAREMIGGPDAWTQGVSARDGADNKVVPWSDEAVCFCPLGALDGARLSFGNDHVPYYAVLERLSAQMDHGIVGWNDAQERTHEDVLAAFDRAIAIA